VDGGVRRKKVRRKKKKKKKQLLVCSVVLLFWKRCELRQKGKEPFLNEQQAARKERKREKGEVEARG